MSEYAQAVRQCALEGHLVLVPFAGRWLCKRCGWTWRIKTTTTKPEPTAATEAA
jgi:transposase-like protein